MAFGLKHRIFRFIFGEQPVLMMMRPDIHAGERLADLTTAEGKRLMDMAHFIGQFIATPLLDWTP